MLNTKEDITKHVLRYLIHLSFGETEFDGIHLVEFIDMIKILWRERGSYFQKEKINTIKKWHDMLKKQYDILSKVISDMEREVYEVNLLS
ncbi:hypothetical protein [Bartonella sp. OT172YNZD]|uniref:hypothetical protein n=1 Tax=Bartonella sp. OT172YNZD TaxID=3243572 RepID=UPI0035CFD9EB